MRSIKSCKYVYVNHNEESPQSKDLDIESVQTATSCLTADRERSSAFIPKHRKQIERLDDRGFGF